MKKSATTASRARKENNGNGEGSVYKYRNGYRWQLREKFQGKMVVVTSGSEATKLDAKRALARAITDRERGLLVASEKVTVGEWLDRWLHLRKPHVRETTFEQYELRLRLYVPEELKRLTLNKVKRAHILELEAQLSEHLRASTRKKVMEHLSAAFKEAMHQDLLVKNPADSIKVSASLAEKRQPKRRKALTDAELVTFLQEAQSDPLFPLFYLLFSLGLRCSEALGLRWGDVDFEYREIHIVQANKLVKNKPRLGELKTENSRRTLPASPDLLAVLRAHQQNQNVLKAQLGGTWPPHDLIFTTGLGTLLDRHNVQRNIHRICERAGIEKFGTHSGRHTNITNLLRAGHLPEVVAKIAGHSRPSTAMLHYRTVMRDEIRNAEFSLQRHLTLREAAD
ncbi:site-specific integrase [Deinococcus deserti]|uniref:Putative phage integrase n=1 Tax=Deinococcus deserti (strain DSM 17065 / CIP 109153 / LMG 22923 / VCD115) TaxID=546414 RepID=C1D0W5_DEIDV|nr:site-specific integrase [Deinococcus deserti]ACO45489.1 putative phage integrase [Deinococcus deserti VCD115]